MILHFNKEEMINIVNKAGVIAMEIYNSDEKEISYKKDNTPVSNGDIKVNDFLVQELTRLDSNIPIVSEEMAIDDEYRVSLNKFWLIDPIDGTKAFIKKDNGEFTINIALIENQRPIFGIVYAPYFDELYYAYKGEGAYKVSNNQTYKLPIGKPERILYLSKNHHSSPTQEYINELEKQYGEFTKCHMNSSLKLCKIAEGKECIYPKLGLTSEWDTAASDIILFEAKSEIIDQTTNKPPLYNKKSILNNHFVARDREYFRED